MRSSKSKALPETVLLATVENDFGLCPAASALARAEALALLYGTTVYVRDPVSDEVLASRHPSRVKAAAQGRVS